MTRLAITLLLLVACDNNDQVEGQFEQPQAITALAVSENSPFFEPIGYVASAHTGQIEAVALKQGRFLTTTAMASFLADAPIPSGAQRQLVSLAAHADDDKSVTLFAGDARFKTLVSITHLAVQDGGSPTRVEPTATEATFTDGAPTGDEASLTGLTANHGFASSETWTLEYDGQDWWVSGSRSGLQIEPAQTDEAYTADLNQVSFTITGSASPGDQITFDIDSGTEEFDVGGTPLKLAMSPDGESLAMIVHDATLDTPVLQWFDIGNGVIDTTKPSLTVDATPNRMTWSKDGLLYVADRSETSSSFWEVDPTNGTTKAFELPFAVSDIAALTVDGTTFVHLVPVGGRELWVYDLNAETLVDANPWVPGTQGLSVTSAIRGIEAIPLDFEYPELDNAGVNKRGQAVGVSLTAGAMIFVEAETGCLVRDEDGPHPDISSGLESADYQSNFSGSGHVAYLETNAVNLGHILVNPCGGIAPSESWSITFDQVQQGWVVEGSVSGVQATLAYGDRRYVSDDGTISFLLRSGSIQPVDGWAISFRVNAGIHVANGNNDGEDEREIAFDGPGDPVFFQILNQGETAGWDSTQESPVWCVAAESADLVSRVNPATSHVEINWQ